MLIVSYCFAFHIAPKSMLSQQCYNKFRIFYTVLIPVNEIYN